MNIRKKRSPAQKIRVMIIDDHPIVRQGIRLLINSESDMEVTGESESVNDALKTVQQADPDVAVVDLSLKDSSGLDLIKDLQARHSQVRILVLSMHDETFFAERCLRAGARGYITKEEGTEKVVDGIRKVLLGEIYLSDRMAGKMLSKMVGTPQGTSMASVEILTDRELEVFQLIGEGLSTKQIASRLHRSVKTVEAHREHIKEKLKLCNATELLKHAINWVQFEQSK